MKPNIKYVVFVSLKEQPTGHFLNRKYYEPFGSERPSGHLDENNNLVYYVVTTKSPEPRIHGKVVGDKLIREDGQHFQIEQV